jgi:hypothetical protein
MMARPIRILKVTGSMVLLLARRSADYTDFTDKNGHSGKEVQIDGFVPVRLH